MSSCWTVIFGYFCLKRSSEALITGCCTAPCVFSRRSVPSGAAVAGLAADGAVVGAAAAAAGLVGSAAAAGLVASAGLAAAAGVLVGAAAAAAGLVGSAAAGFGGSVGFGASAGLAGAAVGGAAAWPQACNRTSPPKAEVSLRSRRRVVRIGIPFLSSRPIV